ncbi:MAG: exodeoxyribonuclease VII small subunit [Synergistaceae bacterium]|nr:exodeoxyribonuclease VII small subunit [Synergistaceae bacterium]MBP9626247.1 exodeoxyribonuclease VII small subunit [Synergistaceae bacterium]MBP9957474.1 exodeoxyribonuclease VII small subunit [Synergistaceae bacterium]
MSFGDDMDQLQQILDKYETQQLSLEEALVEFERGVALISACRQFLNEAHQKVTLLTEEGEVPFELTRPMVNREGDHSND